jgi:hypothetical protein
MQMQLESHLATRHDWHAREEMWGGFEDTSPDVVNVVKPCVSWSIRSGARKPIGGSAKICIQASLFPPPAWSALRRRTRRLHGTHLSASASFDRDVCVNPIPSSARRRDGDNKDVYRPLPRLLKRHKLPVCGRV